MGRGGERGHKNYKVHKYNGLQSLLEIIKMKAQRELLIRWRDIVLSVSEGNEKDLRSRLQHTLNELQFIQRALDESTIVAITDKTGKITYVNEAFCRISQYSREELIGNTHRLVNSGYHSPEFFKHMWKTIGKGEIWRGEIKNKAKDGSYYWVQSTIVPFLDENGKPYKYVSIRTDITRLKQYEEQIEYMAKQAC